MDARHIICLSSCTIKEANFLFLSFEGQILVGPITIKKPKPLPAELESYVSSGTDGFIIVSFGSYTGTLTSKDKIDVMAAAFGKLKQKVLWKLKGIKIGHSCKFDFLN